MQGWPDTIFYAALLELAGLLSLFSFMAGWVMRRRSGGPTSTIITSSPSRRATIPSQADTWRDYVKWRADDPFLHISIADEGPGIDNRDGKIHSQRRPQRDTFALDLLAAS